MKIVDNSSSFNILKSSNKDVIRDRYNNKNVRIINRNNNTSKKSKNIILNKKGIKGTKLNKKK